MHTLLCEIISCPLHELCGDADASAASHESVVVEAVRRRDTQPALRDLQIHRNEKAVAAVLIKRIPAADTDVGGSVLHIGRNIGRADHDDAKIIAVRRNHELAALFGILNRVNPSRGEEGKRFLINPPFGEGHGDHSENLLISAPRA